MGTHGQDVSLSGCQTCNSGESDTEQSYSHDVGFVNSRHAVPLVVPGVLEGVLSDAPAGVLSDQLDALDDAVDDLRHKKTASEIISSLVCR